MKRSEIKKLDKLWSKIIKERARYKCQFCRGTSCLNSAHIIGRANRALRWDIENGMCLCYVCHRAYDTHQPRHEEIREKVIGQDKMDRLIIKARNIFKQDYEHVYVYLGKQSKLHVDCVK